MKKFILSILSLTMLSSSVFAEGQNTIDFNRYKERKELINKINTRLVVGWYTGVVDNFNFKDLMPKYLPLSNYLSRVSGDLVVLENSRNDDELVEEALNGMYDIVYTSALAGTKLVNKGWMPIAGRKENIKGVILVNTEKVKNLNDNAKIIAAKGATVTYYAKYTINSKKLNMSIDDNNGYGQQELIRLLDENAVDGIVVRNTLAENYLKSQEKSSKYKILFEADVSPGHMVFINTNSGVFSKQDSLKNALIQIDNTDPYLKMVAKSLDGYQENDKNPFKAVALSDLQLSQKVADFLKNSK